MNKKEQKAIKVIQSMQEGDKVKLIQSMSEGGDYEIIMNSLLDGSRLNGETVDGISNAFTSYSAQTSAIYKKYNGYAEFGNDQVRTIVDLRSSFIAGEGVKATFGKEVTEEQRKFINDFIKKNKLDTYRTFDIAKRTEMAGHCISYIDIKKNKEGEIPEMPRLILIPNYTGGIELIPIYKNKFDESSIEGFNEKDCDGYKQANIENFIYFRTGGDGCNLKNTTTKIGVVLTECENYDRALGNIRDLNYKCTRITPTIETKSGQETKGILAWLRSSKWKIGQAFVGTSKLSYQSPTSSALTNLQIELSAMVKTICGVTSVPIHWVGHVDLMSNRATASELYSMINCGTIMERRVIEEGIKDACIKAQTLFINSGGGEILKTGFTDDFEINIPMLDFGRLEELTKSNSQLYNDGVICLETYRSRTPSIDPDFEREADEKQIVNKTNININENDQEDLDNE